jgi:hypothetical protein
MTITSQRGRTGFTMAPERAVEGAIAEGPKPVGRPVAYPKRRSIWLVTFDGAEVGDGTYTGTIDLSGFEQLEITMVVEGGELLDLLGESYDPVIPVTDENEAAAAWARRVTETLGALDMVDSATATDAEVSLLFRLPGRVASASAITVDRLNTWVLTYLAEANAESTLDGTYTATLTVTGFDPVELELEVDDGELLDLLGDPYDVAVPVTTETELAAAWVLRLEEIEGSGDVATATADAGEITIVFTPSGEAGDVTDVAVPADQAQVVDFTVLGDPAGASSITINGTAHNVDPTGKTDAQVRDEFIAAIEGGAQGAVVAATIKDANELRVTASVPGVRFTYSAVVAVAALFTANRDVEGEAEETLAGSAEAAATEETQAPVGQPIPVGRFLVEAVIDGHPGARLPEDGDEAGDIAGVVLRSHTFPSREDRQPADADGPEVVDGDMITLFDRVTFTARNVGDVAADTNGQAYVVMVDDGGDTPGQVRADADGGNAVAPTNLAARWLEPTAAGALGPVRVRR